MLEPKSLQVLKSHIFAGPTATVFAILDGASVPRLLENLERFGQEHICLYRGELAPDMAEVAPYLAILPYMSPFTDWVLGNGWGEHWGIFGVAQGNLQELRKHFRKFLTVYDQAGNSLYFRYYDPRVLRVYLPTCNRGELQIVFGPVQSYFTEDERPESGLAFSFSQDVLHEGRFLI